MRFKSASLLLVILVFLPGVAFGGQPSAKVCLSVLKDRSQIVSAIKKRMCEFNPASVDFPEIAVNRFGNQFKVIGTGIESDVFSI
jgi:hypothetical protein